jgi:hypothetical protein
MTHAPLVADGRSALRRKAEARFDLRLNPKSAYRPAGGGLIGALGAGLVAAPLGAPLTVAIGGAVCLAGGLTFGAGLSALRGPARELIVAQQVTAGGPPDDATRLQE